LSGRALDNLHEADTIHSVLVNEAFVASVDKTNQSVLGMTLTGYSRPAYDPVVVGVVRNFNYMPARERVAPTLFRQKNQYVPTCIYVRIKPGGAEAVLASIRKAWIGVTGDALFDYQFLDAALNARYAQEEKLGRMVIWAAGIAIFLATLGLGSLAFLSVENRTRELVIRKIFGGSASNILVLVTRDFVRLVLIAWAIATPLAWWILHDWLNQYAYRIPIHSWIFALTGFCTLLFTVATLCITVRKVNDLSPALLLRTE
jgi:putative ABC transport system permease protein